LQRFLHQQRQYGGSDTAASPGLHHCHSPDVAARQQSSGAYGLPLAITSQRMDALTIGLIPFELLRYPLLLDEDCTAHRMERFTARVPVDDAHAVQWCIHGVNYNSLRTASRPTALLNMS
jgi:hypothetical protein